MNCIWVNLKNLRSTLRSLYQNGHLHSWKIILICYVAVIVKMKFLLLRVNLTFRIIINKIKQNDLK